MQAVRDDPLNACDERWLTTLIEPADRPSEAHVMKEGTEDMHTWTTTCPCDPYIEAVMGSDAVYRYVVAHEERIQ